MRIFISWSKDKSKELALETKKLLQNVFGNALEIFFSPDMYKGTCVDHEIHTNLLESDKCIICITSDNYKNPWLMYEAGVVYGAHYSMPGGGIVIPILFDQIPRWSSWIDKPLNRYVPINLYSYDNENEEAKDEVECFLKEIASNIGIKPKNFSKQWKIYIQNVHQILTKNQLIPKECIDLVNQLLEDNSGTFTINSPEITREHILFHKGFSTNVLTRLLLKNVMEYQSKRLWIFGRRNKKIFTSENDDFFKFLAEEGIPNNVDFKCLFPYPESDATSEAVSKDKERRFKADLQTCLEAAVRFKSRFNLPVSDIFRLYKSRRTNYIIVSDDAVLHTPIIRDTDGRPLPITNSSFEVLSISEENMPENKGRKLCQTFIDTWNDSIPLTEELYNSIYN